MRNALVVVIATVLTVLTAIVSTPLFYVGWNLGMPEAFNLHRITWVAAFGLSLFVCSIVGTAKNFITLIVS